jgi:Ca2+-binding EF-hand superfamily protein
MADIDADGKISLEELIFAIKEAVDDTSDEGKKVLGFVCDAISKLDIQNEEQVDE